MNADLLSRYLRLSAFICGFYLTGFGFSTSHPTLTFGSHTIFFFGHPRAQALQPIQFSGCATVITLAPHRSSEFGWSMYSNTPRPQILKHFPQHPQLLILLRTTKEGVQLPPDAVIPVMYSIFSPHWCSLLGSYLCPRIAFVIKSSRYIEPLYPMME